MRGRYWHQLLVVLLAVGFTAGAVFLLNRQAPGAEPVAAPAEGTESPASLIAVPLLLLPGSEGLALIDRKHQTICIYQIQPRRAAHERFVLLAARSFRYDCQLEDYNTAEPRPEAVKELLQGRSAGVSGEGPVTESRWTTSPVPEAPAEEGMRPVRRRGTGAVIVPAPAVREEPNQSP